jgi:hypothetical protein
VPPNPFAFALVRRAAWLWAGVRVTTAMLAGIAQLPLLPTSAGLVGLLLLSVTGLAGFDLYRRREFIFFANLGAAPMTVVLVGSVTALLLELLLIALKGLFR